MSLSLLQRAEVRGQLWPSSLRARALQILRLLGQEQAELSVLLAGDQEIRALNLQFRGLDKPTDVLSFPPPEELCLPPGVLRPLGEIVISLETASRQLEEGCLPRIRELIGARSWSLLDEVSFLFIHGILHLLGHDHLQAEEARQMEALEASLLSQLLRL